MAQSLQRVAAAKHCAPQCVETDVRKSARARLAGASELTASRSVAFRGMSRCTIASRSARRAADARSNGAAADALARHCSASCAQTRSAPSDAAHTHREICAATDTRFGLVAVHLKGQAGGGV